MSTETADNLFTLSELARNLGLPKSTTADMCAAGVFAPDFRSGAGGLYFNPDRLPEIEAAIANHKLSKSKKS